jgi:YVTN family beta-propeller protein
MVRDGAFVEWAHVHAFRYGTSVSEVEAAQRTARGIAFDIDYQGAERIKKTHPEAVGVFILPPSMDELQRRLRGRATDDEAAVQRRFRKAREEIQHYALFDYLIVNDDLDAAYDRLYVIDTSTNTVIKRVIVGDGPERVTITPDGAFAYVTNSGSGTVSVVDTSTDAVVVTTDVGRSPFGIAFSPDGQAAYVTNAGSDTVSVIDTGSRTVIATIPVHRTPMDIAVTPDGASAYVVNQRSETVSVIDTRTATVSLVVSVPRPIGIAVAPDGASVYVGNRARAISVISRATHMVTSTIALRASPTNLALSRDGAFLYVTSFGEPGNVAVVDIATKSVVATIPVGDQPRNIAIAQLPYAAGPVTEFINPIIPDLQLIDASGNVVADPDALGVAAKMSARTPGAAADGVTRLVLRAWSDTPVTFELPGSLADGCLAAVGAPQQCNPVLRDVTPQFVASVGRSAAFALYITPPDFSALPTSSVNRSIVIQTASATGSRDYQLNLWRPPIVLVHGLWGDPGMWDEMVARLNNHFDALPFVHRSNYEHSNAARLAVNESRLALDVRQAVNDLAAMGIVAVQADVVAKSMGGLLARLAAQGPLGKRRANYGEGDIHKLITLSTPHCGASLAQILSGCFDSSGTYQNTVTCTVARYTLPLIPGVGPIDKGAIFDLMPGSAAIGAIDRVEVPSHAVVGDAIPAGPLSALACLGALGNCDSEFCEPVRTVFQALRWAGLDSVLAEPSDLVVELSSQIGNLPPAAITRFPVLHVGLPKPLPCSDLVVQRNDEVGDWVAQLLKEEVSAGVFASAVPPGSSCGSPLVVPNGTSAPISRVVVAGLRIVRPQPGTGFRTGETVPIEWLAEGDFLPAEALVLTQVGTKAVAGAVTTSDVTLPSEFTGELSIVVVARDAAGRISADRVMVVVRPSTDPVALDVQPSPVAITGFPLARHQQLRVRGVDERGLSLDLKLGTTGTVYASASPRVATVGSDGLVTAEFPGTTEIIVTHGAASRRIPVLVTKALDVELHALLCTADCNQDGEVTVDEILTGVNIALGSAPFDVCLTLDVDGDRQATVDELLKGVNSALNGCGE